MLKRCKLLVKVRGVRINTYCYAQKRHSLRESKKCPYCRVCKHGITEYGHCDECSSMDQSWRRKPITKAEMAEVIRWLESTNPGYLERRSGRQRDYTVGVALVPLAVAKLRKLLGLKQE